MYSYNAASNETVTASIVESSYDATSIKIVSGVLLGAAGICVTLRLWVCKKLRNNPLMSHDWWILIAFLQMLAASSMIIAGVYAILLETGPTKKF